jgi:hypothetical protein
MLKLWAEPVMRGTPMSKHEKLNIFGGRSGEGRSLLSPFVDELEKREGTK